MVKERTINNKHPFFIKLRENEWSMGNGQCSECCGVAPTFYDLQAEGEVQDGQIVRGSLGKLKYQEDVGHELKCATGIVLEDLGYKVIWKA